MISNMLRFPASILENRDDWFFPQFSENAALRPQLRAYPPVNMGSTDSSVEVYLFVPGMDAKALDISLEKNLLSIAGERKPLDQDSDQAEDVSRRERFYGRFKRVITLPEDVDPEKTEAVYRDGVLHIRIAKREETLPRQIKVNVQ